MLLHGKTNMDAHNKSKSEVISIEILKIKNSVLQFSVNKNFAKSRPL